MKKRIGLYLILVCMVSSLLSCESRKVEPDPNRLGYDYFPLETGRFAIFDVQETYFSLTADSIVRTYQVKDEVAESFTDLSGETAFQLLRYSRKDTISNWQLDSVWTAKRTPSQAIRTENNVSFIKMVFPLKDKQNWNGNALNDRGNDDYSIESLGKPYQTPRHTFGSTFTVVQQADSSLVAMDRRMEVYAQNVGLVYRHIIKISYCQSSADCLGKGKIDFGVKIYHRLHSYGKN